MLPRCLETSVGAGGVVADVDVVLSLQPPKNPRWTQLVDVLVVVDDEVLGSVARGVVRVGLGFESAAEVVVGSLQPNQPGVLQVLVEEVDVEVVVVVGVPLAVVVVLSSRQPHQPGVLHVLVRVRVLDLVLVLDVVVVSELLLSKNFQLKQSTHSVFALHGGTSS